jgi:hypothetical protein
VDNSVFKHSPAPEKHFQFERVGFFVVDKDTADGKLVFNLTVTLKDGGKPTTAAAAGKRMIIYS